MDKKIRSYKLDSPKKKRACMSYLEALRPSEYEGDVYVVFYEHVVTVPRDLQSAYWAKLNDFANRYHQALVRVAEHTGHTVNELCVELHKASDGFYWNRLPRSTEFHEAAKKRINNGGTTTHMDEEAFKKYRQLAYRYVEEICDGLDRWAAENFGC